MANQVAGSQTKLAADVEALNSNLENKPAFTGDVHTASAGWYRVAANAQNLPVATSGFLLVVQRSSTLKFLQFTTDSGRFFTQTNNDDNWLDWHELWAHTLTVQTFNVPSTQVAKGLFSIPVAIGKTGLDPLGIVAFNLSRQDNTIYQGLYIDGSNAYINGNNMGSTVSVTGTIRVLYQSI